jgi:hypothetical protein
MKHRVIAAKSVVFLLLVYPILGAVGWFFGGIYLCLFGLVIANLIDRIWPSWVYKLTWENIDLALDNLGKYGATACNLCFRIRGRKFFIYRDEKDFPCRYGLRIPLEHWKDIYTTEDLKIIYKTNGVLFIGDEFQGLDCLSSFPPGDYLLTCKKILKQFIQAASADLEKDVFARVDYAKKDIWKKYDDDEIEEQKKERMEKIEQQQKNAYQQLKNRYIEEAKKEQAKDKEHRRKAREKRIRENAKQRSK